MSTSDNSIIIEQIIPIEYFCDFVFCLDITGGMAPLLRNFKKAIVNLHNMLEELYLEYSRKIVSLRVKIIAFRDIYFDGQYWLETSDFFSLPSQTNELLDALDSLDAKGGGDDPESSLEALALAMKTDWVKISDLNTQRSRHVIVLFTDDAAHKFEEVETYTGVNYPSGIPKSYNELWMFWNGSQPLDGNTERTLYMDKRAKRILIFAPERCYPWDDMIEDFSNMYLVPVEQALGVSDISSETMLKYIRSAVI